MKKLLLAFLAATSLVSRANAQTVEFRIVERDGQTIVPSPLGTTPTSDAVLNFAVQARVVGGAATQFLGDFDFDIVAFGEPDTYGTLTKLLISNPDGTYSPNTANSTNISIGRGGLAAIYTYLAGINPNFNGLINTSGGTFTNTPGSQQIGLVTGSPTGNALLLLTDSGGTGNPDTYPGSGTSAPIDPTIASTYLGAGGNFVDVYRFKYLVGNTTTSRNVTFGLENAAAKVGSSLQLINGVWGPAQFNVSATSATITISVDGAPGACCDSMGGCTLVMPAACSGGSSVLGGACAPNPCPQLGACCAPEGACVFRLQADCSAPSMWIASGSCAPNPCPQPGTCCSAAGACSITPLLQCFGGVAWMLGGACAPNPCPQPGTCCALDGSCTFVVQYACAAGLIWNGVQVCSPNPCPLPGTCCSTAGSCSFGLHVGCAGSWNLGGACNPNPCPQPGRCCTFAGPCTVVLQSTCDGSWSGSAGCIPSPCPGACCQGTTCSFTDQMNCAGSLSGQFHGSGTTCGTFGNPTTCCPANFNGLNGLGVQDIFDFLAAWFAHDPRADFDHDGSLGVFDIFTFLHAWFVGC